MKVKEILLSANITWSPEGVQPIYIACGTSAQQYDTTSNSTPALQIYNLSAGVSSLDVKLAASTNVPDKFNKILWSGKQDSSGDDSMGIIVGGCNNGSVYLYSASKLFKDQDPLIGSMEKRHMGPIYTLDFNQHQPNLLATGSSECEIFIWDINDTTNPMTPAAKPNLAANVSELAWNRQVEHIMAATFDGRCAVYDLRKSASIIQITESVSRLKARNVKWHPSVATQLILTSDDDGTPMGQVWDLRFATAPLKSLGGHQRGIVATDWCAQDPDLFLTSGKDNKIYIWNPNNEAGAEIVSEFPSYNQWAFDVSWCNKDPSLVATSSVDGMVSVYSILGAGVAPSQNNKFSAIADSFPGMEVPSVVPQMAQPQSIYLKYPPKWFSKRCGASFAFGGRLLSWNASDRHVTVSQVVTEPELVKRSGQLEEALSKSDLSGFCQSKVQSATNSEEKVLWSFVAASLEASPRPSYMNLLGFMPNQVASLVRPQDLAITPEDLADKISRLGPQNQDEKSSSLDPSEQFEMIASAHSCDKTPEAEALSEEDVKEPPLVLSIGEDTEGMIRHALLMADFPSAVELCLKQKANSLALIIAGYAGEELFKSTQERVLKKESHRGLTSLVKSIVQNDLFSLVSKCELTDWKEALVSVLTYAPDNELTALTETLGDRLEAVGGAETLNSAVLCYLCAGNLEKFVAALAKTKDAPLDSKQPSTLLEVVEIMIVLQKALVKQGRSIELKEASCASNYLCAYASLLASQGAFSNAVSYLTNNPSPDVAQLRDRLYRCLGYQTSASLAPRNRSISTSSQHSLRRTSTPFSGQQAPNFGVPAAGQPSAFGAPTPNFFNPQTPQMQQPGGFMQPTAMVSPSFGGGAPPASNLSQQFHPPAASPAGPPPVGPSTGTTGFRRSAAPNRYIQDTPVASSGPNPGGLPGSPGIFNPSNVPKMTPTAHIPPMTPQMGFNPTPPAPVQTIHQRPLDPAMAAEAHEGTGPNVFPAAYDPSVPRGWNDPPPLSAGRKTKSKFSSADSAPAEAPSGFMVPEPPKQLQGFSAPAANLGHGAPPRVAPSNVPETPLPKAPLPPEHQVIQDVFGRLTEKGLQSNINPAAKQRLHDLSVKLQVLYDKISTGQVGQSTLNGLHEMCQAITSADYMRALQIHSATINSGNFSEMSQFMPFLKMLITTCMQCQIFY